MKTHFGSRRLNTGAQIRLTDPSSRRGLTLVLRVKNPKDCRLRQQRVHQLAYTNSNKCSDGLQVSMNEVPETVCHQRQLHNFSLHPEDQQFESK